MDYSKEYYEFYECFDMSVKDKDSKYFHLIVLARNEEDEKLENDCLKTKELALLHFDEDMKNYYTL